MRTIRAAVVVAPAPRCEGLERRRLLSLSPPGPEFQVNTYTSASQYTPSVAMEPTGDFVVVWISPQDGSGYGVYAQRYNAAGVPQGGEFRVNTHTTDAQQAPNVAMDSHGNFVIVWESGAQDGSSLGVYAQRFSSTGMPLGGEFRVNTFTTSSQRWPKVALDALGNFVVTWTSNGQEGSGYGVYARRYNAAGTALSGEFRVNSYTTAFQSLSAIAMDSSGDFTIAWHSYGQDGSGTGIYAQRYNAAGSPQGGEFRANTYTTQSQGLPTVAMDAGGDFVIAWQSRDQDGSGDGVYAQRYNALGVPQGGEFRANTQTADFQRYPSVAMDGDGDLIVTWSSQAQDGSAYGVYAKRYAASGAAQGGEFRVNTFTPGDQRYPVVALDFDGDAAIAWESRDQDGSALGVFARQVAPGIPAPAVSEAAFRFQTAPQRLRFVFDQDVGSSLGVDDLVVQALPGGATVSPNIVVFDPVTFTATFTFNSILPDASYRATLVAAGITTAGGTPMSDDYSFDFHFLRGDANHDARVNLQDFNILASNFGQSGPGIDFTRGDFNYDATVNLQDFNLLAARFGTALVPGGAREPGRQSPREHLRQLLDDALT